MRKPYAVLVLATSVVTAACGGSTHTTQRSLCPAPTVTVRNATQLTAALTAARPSSSIRMRRGHYVGQFSVTVGGTATAPVTLCADSGAVVDAGDIRHGYALHIVHADWVRIVGLELRGGQKGIVVDGSQHVTIDTVTVEAVGDEGVHFRSGSSDGRISNSTIRDTGRLNAALGEGIYVGSAVEHWCEFAGCSPDRSDRLDITGDTLGPDVRAEAVDVKEGTTGGAIRRTTVDAAGSAADSVIDVKGNNWSVTDVVIRNATDDGVKAYVRAPGWGSGTMVSHLTVDGAIHGLAVDAVGAARSTTSACLVSASDGHEANVGCRS